MKMHNRYFVKVDFDEELPLATFLTSEGLPLTLIHTDFKDSKLGAIYSVRMEPQHATKMKLVVSNAKILLFKENV